TGGRRRVVEQARECVDVHPVLVLRHFDERRAKTADDRDGAEIRRRRDHDGVAFIEREPAHELERVLGAVGDEHIGGGHRRTVGAHVRGDPFAELGQARSWCVLQRFGAESGERVGGLAREIGQYAGECVSRIECDFVVRVGRGHNGRQVRGAPRERGRWHPPKAPILRKFYLYGQNAEGQESVKRRPCGRLGEGGRGEQDSGEVGASQGRLSSAPYYSMASPAVAWRASSTALKGQTQGYQRRGRFISNLTVRNGCARCSQKKSTFAR